MLAKKNLKTYLAGPINHKNPDAFAYAKKWREDVAENLAIINIECLDPLKRTDGDTISPELRAKLRAACANEDLEIINEIVGKIIIPPDLKMVEEADFITLYLPLRDSYEICGTYGEATLAKYLNIPVYLITERENHDIPEWVIGCCKDVFNSWDAYYLHIVNEYHSTVVK
jgi:hypothetical protein